MATKKTKPAAAQNIGAEPTTATAAETAAATAESTTKATKPARGARAAKSGKGTGNAAKPRQRPAVGDTDAKAERKPRTDTKQAKLIEMLKAKDGATVEEIAAAFGWQAHTVRGALYGALKKKLGLDIVSEKIEGRGRVYRIGN